MTPPCFAVRLRTWKIGGTRSPCRATFVYYDNFNEGEVGVHNDFLDGYKLFRGILIYQGTWRGENVQRNMDGTIGPRQALVPLGGGNAITGLPNGYLQGFHYTGNPGKDLIVVVANRIFTINSFTGGPAQEFSYASTFNAPASTVAFTQSADRYHYLTSPGDQTYCLDTTLMTCKVVPNAPGGTCITIHQGIMCIGNIAAGRGNRMAVSSPFAPGNPGETRYPFPVTPQYFDVDDEWSINGLYSQRTHLAILKQVGFYIATGDFQSTANTSIRRVTTQDGPYSPNTAVRTGDGNIWYIPLFFDLPASFNGSQAVQQRKQRFAGGYYTFPNNFIQPMGAMYGVQPHDVLFVAGADNTGSVQDTAPIFTSPRNVGLHLHNGAWSHHTYGVDTSGYLAYGTQNGTYFASSGAPADHPYFYQMATEIDRPSKTTDGRGGVQDGVLGGNAASVANPNWFELPEWESRDGSEVIVRAVHVSLKKWNTGYNQTNHFACKVTSVRQWSKQSDNNIHQTSQPYGQTSQIKEWNEAPGVTQADATRQHVVMRFGDQGSGNGFKVRFDNLRGISIEKIQVIIDVMPTRS